MSAEINALTQNLRQRIAQEPALNDTDIDPRPLPTIRFTTQRIELEQLALGATRIGGVPDVPRDFEWPHWTPDESAWDRSYRKWDRALPVPLAFIAQIDLSAIPRIDDDLPPAGWLCFFYDRVCEPWGFDPGDRGSCRVLYFDGPREQLQRAVTPPSLVDELASFPCQVEAKLGLTIEEDVDLPFDTPSYDAYRQIWWDLLERRECQHTLLGWPCLVQGSMERECQLTSHGVDCGGGSIDLDEQELKRLEAGAADWRLLLQIDSDEEGPGWMWGDAGRIYFWIRRQDLAARNFDNVWIILQCY